MASIGTNTFVEIVQQIADLTQNTNSTSRKAKIKKVVNVAYDEALNGYDWPQLKWADESGLRIYSDTDLKTLELNEDYAPMPPSADEVTGLHYQDTGYPPIEILEADDFYHRVNGRLTTVGRPCIATQTGETCQIRKLAATGAVTAYSTSVNASKTVRVYYEDTAMGPGFGPPWEDVTGADFTAGIALSVSPRAGWPIKKVSLPAGWIGNFQLRDSGAVNIVDMPALEKPVTAVNSNFDIASRALFRFWPQANADYPLTVIFRKHPTRLTEDEDVPAIPVASYLVEYGIGAMLEEDRREQPAAIHFQKAERILARAAKRHQPAFSVARPRRGNVLSANNFHSVRLREVGY